MVDYADIVDCAGFQRFGKKRTGMSVDLAVLGILGLMTSQTSKIQLAVIPNSAISCMSNL